MALAPSIPMTTVPNLLQLGSVFCGVFAITIYLVARFRKGNDPRYPPIIQITTAEQFTKTRDAYGEALQKHGPVIGVWRKGRLEYVTDKTYVKEVLTQDHIFSFEEGAFEILNLRFLLAFRGREFFCHVEDLVLEGIVRPLQEITSRLFPVVDRRTQAYVDMACRGSSTIGQGADFKEFCHQVVVENMMFVTFGQHLDQSHLKTVATLETDLSTMMGMFQNTDFFSRTFPATWRILAFMRVFIFTVIPGFLFVLGPHIWRAINAFEQTHKHSANIAEDNDIGLVRLLAKKWIDTKTGQVSVLRRMWIVIIVAGFVFASVHNTTIVTVWVMYELARRPEYLQQLRDELAQISESGEIRLTSASLKGATHLDSFIREVLRLKGDTISQVRRSTCDAPLGKYIIPQGHLITTLATTVNEDPDVLGHDATAFDGFACPGRGLAVNEIKLLILTFIAKATPTLKPGSYKVTDPMNTAAVAPTAVLLVERLKDPLF
ncbi:cytochrome P450 [Mycena sp. CBHHK59/15]|nr:cytochrome P450 [Mycena sp. CBHHK59/15]